MNLAKMLPYRLIGLHLRDIARGTKMVMMAFIVLAVWSLVATAAGFAVAAVIQRGEQSHKDEFLTLLFETIANQQASR